MESEEAPSDHETQPNPQTGSSRRNQQTRRNNQSQQNPKCRPRIDQLAIPSRRLILALYQQHGHHLSKEKVEKIKVLLQELYAMTPEETEKYFEHLQKQAEEIGRRKDLKFMLRRLVKKRKKAKQVRRAYEFVRSLFVKGMEYSVRHPIPPLVTVRLRNLSNIILEQICDLKNVKIPNRDEQDAAGFFLIQVADWMAIAVEHLYYGVQLKKNQELEKIETEAKAKAKEEHKTTLEDLEAAQSEEEGESEASEGVLSEPLLLSEME